MESFVMMASDNQQISVKRWLPKGSPRAVVLILHGMAEHASRYNEFAEHLTALDFAVVAPDHRGHGETAGAPENLGYFAEEKGWDRVQEDLKGMVDLLQSEYSGKEILLMAHSMGSYLGRDLLTKRGEAFAGAIFTATDYNSPLLLRYGHSLAVKECKKLGDHHRSIKLDKMSFGAFNKPFQPARTDFDWLSRDEKEVDGYVNDPLCGFVCTSRFFADLTQGLQRIADVKYVSKTPLDLPILLYSGEFDPTRKGQHKVLRLFKRAGMKNVKLEVHPGGRHESLHETDREEVFQRFSSFFQEILQGK